MNQASQLHQLQTMDTDLDRISLRIAQIDKVLASDQRVNAANQEVQNAQKNAHEMKRRLQTAEEAVAAVRVKINTSEASLYGGKIRNPKELQDLQTEIAAHKRRLAVLEDEQLEAMLNLEQAEVDFQASAENLIKTQAASTSDHAALAGEKNQLLNTAEKTQTSRSVAAASILPENLAIYDRLRRSKRGLAVSRVEDDACSACGTSVRPAEIQVARSPQQMAYCSTCGRILYAG